MEEQSKWWMLAQASKWLSEKTKEEWPHERIIKFSIQQCRPDDIVADKQSPSYLRAILPIAQEIYIPDTGIIPYRDKFETVINSLVYVGSELKETTELFKSNLKQLSETGKTEISYTFLSDEAAQAYQKTASEMKCQDELAAFAVLEPAANLFKQLDFSSLQDAFPYIVHAGIPYFVEISIESVGIREKELKKLLRRYFEISSASKLNQQGQSSPLPKREHNTPENKIDDAVLAGKGKAEGASIGTVKYLQHKKRIYPMDELIEEAIAEADSEEINPVFLKLKAFAKENPPPPPLTGGCGANYIEYEKSNGEKEDFTKDALRKKLTRRRGILEKTE